MITIEKKRALNDKEILELIKSCLNIEKHYKMPMDIEWAIKDDEVYILQARAITTLKHSIDSLSEDNLVQKYTKDKKINKSTRKMMSFLLEKMPLHIECLISTILRQLMIRKLTFYRKSELFYQEIRL